MSEEASVCGNFFYQKAERFRSTFSNEQTHERAWVHVRTASVGARFRIRGELQDMLSERAATWLQRMRGSLAVLVSSAGCVSFVLFPRILPKKHRGENSGCRENAQTGKQATGSSLLKNGGLREPL